MTQLEENATEGSAFTALECGRKAWTRVSRREDWELIERSGGFIKFVVTGEYVNHCLSRQFRIELPAKKAHPRFLHIAPTESNFGYMQVRAPGNHCKIYFTDAANHKLFAGYCDLDERGQTTYHSYYTCRRPSGELYQYARFWNPRRMAEEIERANVSVELLKRKEEGS